MEKIKELKINTDSLGALSGYAISDEETASITCIPIVTHYDTWTMTSYTILTSSGVRKTLSKFDQLENKLEQLLFLTIVLAHETTLVREENKKEGE